MLLGSLQPQHTMPTSSKRSLSPQQVSPGRGGITVQPPLPGDVTMWLRGAVRDRRFGGRVISVVLFACFVCFIGLRAMNRVTEVKGLAVCEKESEQQRASLERLTALVDECDAARDQDLR